jgi:hypothetical protein
MSKKNDAHAHSEEPENTGSVARGDVDPGVEGSIAHVILEIIGPVAEIVIDAIPDALDVITDIIDVIGDVVWDVTKEVLVHVIVEVILHVFTGAETRQTLVDLGLGELDPGLEGLEALAANPAARELFAKRMIEARQEGKEFPLPSARELMEYRDRYLRGAIGQQGK